MTTSNPESLRLSLWTTMLFYGYLDESPWHNPYWHSSQDGEVVELREAS